MARRRTRRTRRRSRSRRTRRRSRSRGGSGVVAALKTALLPFLLYKAQKMQQKRSRGKTKKRRRK
jgi:hypothetical protein